MVSDQSNPEDEWEEHLYQRANTLISSDELAGKSSEDQKRYVREKLNQLIDEDKGADHLPEIDEPQREEIVKSLVHELVGYGPLEPLVEREDITEIMVNGAKEVYVEKDDAMIETDVEFRDNEHVMRTVRQILAPMGRRVDDDQPFVDARLPDGSRVNVIVPPLIMQGPTVTIRKFQDEFHDLQDLIELGTLNESMVDFLRACVQARINMVISGGTTTGKTTLLNCLSDFIPDDERIVTIEETVELQLQNKHVLQCETRDPNIEGKGEVTARDLLRNSLRMRPDRIIVGESRGPEALDMLQAMNTGHDGSLTTVHANNPRESVSRLETLMMMGGTDLPMMALRRQIVSAIDLMIHLERFPDGSRKITKINELTGMEGEIVQQDEIYRFERRDTYGDTVRGHHVKTGVVPSFMDRLQDEEIDLPRDHFMD